MDSLAVLAALLALGAAAWVRVRWAPVAAWVGDGVHDVLLVTAHPDDECMFFTPTLRALDAHRVHVLCLSTGDYDGLGDVRREELPRACAMLGIPSSRVAVVDDDALRDGHPPWHAGAVSDVVARYVAEWGIDVVLTFDDGGVSGHVNHCDTARGVRHMLRSEAGRGVRGLALITTSFARKYSGMLDVLATPLDGRAALHAWSGSVSPAYRAMVQHRSQCVWWRRLFVAFSRYTYINTLLPIE